MATNSGCFVKGEKRPNQGKRGPGKVPSQARAALAEFADANAGRLQGWLDDVAERDGAAAAFGLYGDVAGGPFVSMRNENNARPIW